MSGDACSEQKNAADHTIDQFVARQAYLENAEERQLRHRLVDAIDSICQQWIASSAAATTSASSPPPSGKLFLSGSYGLDVHSRSSDLDLVLLAPQCVSVDQFFNRMPPLLRSQLPTIGQHQWSVAEINGQHVFMPLIKMHSGGCRIAIDLLYCQSRLLSVDSNVDVLTDVDVKRVIDGFHESDMPLEGQLANERFYSPHTAERNAKNFRAISGYRINQFFLHSIAERELFLRSLRVVRLWARRRLIYSNAYGFLGGISWAILLARVLSDMRQEGAATGLSSGDSATMHVLNVFFNSWSRYPWSSGWNPAGSKSLGEAAANHHQPTPIMQIVTPVAPQQNSAHNISASQFSLIVSELRRADQLFRADKPPLSSASALLQHLCRPFPFFHRYKHYWLIVAKGSAHWRGLIDSRMRCLVELVEHNRNVRLAHIYPNSDYRAAAASASSWLIGLCFRDDAPGANLEQEIVEFQHFQLKFKKAGDQISFYPLKRHELADRLPAHMLREHPELIHYRRVLASGALNTA